MFLPDWVSVKTWYFIWSIQFFLKVCVPTSPAINSYLAGVPPISSALLTSLPPYTLAISENRLLNEVTPSGVFKFFLDLISVANQFTGSWSALPYLIIPPESFVLE